MHSIYAAVETLFDGSDVVHVHAIGPGLVIPLLRLMGKKVVFTHHGADYQREKWGWLAKKVLKLGERLAINYATEVIVISKVIQDQVRQSYRRDDTHLIHNGVASKAHYSEDEINIVMSQYALSFRGYIVAVGRFVEEKGFHDLIEAYSRSNLTLPLVLIGDADHDSVYSQSLKQKARQTPGVIMTGLLTGAALQIVFSQARLFVMPSYHEGLPIALLEALSYSLPVIVSDIAPNKEIGLAQECYFQVKNIEVLTHALMTRSDLKPQDYSMFLNRYDWYKIATQTSDVYHLALGISCEK